MEILSTAMDARAIAALKVIGPAQTRLLLRRALKKLPPHYL